ncbi:hemolysin family protein [Caulobacter mirabilis]|uniref:Magnesium/cobalt efflux protein n=1 Tax=Caulobacter mirabilis TaxID=69666 RepID=A0A2D2ASQ5_9CAUL|nr:hemolysin family protein [Caulobacter mirabilis]ATQ41048.1 magnesium/cobalt efflux protein [Caulobacter mirabilis]
MPSSDDSSPQPAEPPRRSRGLRALFRRLRRDLSGEPVAELEATPAHAAAAALVGQARAFQTLTVDDVMTPRADIIAVDISTSFDALVAQFVETEHSRLPIYRDTLDQPVGVVHIKDVFRAVAGKGRKPAGTSEVLKRLKREILYVPTSMKAADLLAQMQKSRVHMALVIDEHGGTEGLVTLEDLIEAVVGEIDDEHDEAAVSGVVARAGGVFDADARAPLEDLEAALGAEDLSPANLDEEIDTVGGLVTAIAGRVPRRGEVVTHPAGYDLEVVDADPRRVKRVRVRPRRTDDAAEAPAA